VHSTQSVWWLRMSTERNSSATRKHHGGAWQAQGRAAGSVLATCRGSDRLSTRRRRGSVDRIRGSAAAWDARRTVLLLRGRRRCVSDGRGPRLGRRASVSSGSCHAPPFARCICPTAERAAPRGRVNSEPDLTRGPERTSRNEVDAGSRPTRAQKGDERWIARRRYAESSCPMRRVAVHHRRERRDSNPRPPA